jgi:hypothetical protein
MSLRAKYFKWMLSYLGVHQLGRWFVKLHENFFAGVSPTSLAFPHPVTVGSEPRLQDSRCCFSSLLQTSLSIIPDLCLVSLISNLYTCAYEIGIVH